MMELPKRKRGHYLGTMKKTNLATNLYKVGFDDRALINIYSIKIHPDLAQNSTQKLLKLIDSIKEKIEPIVGCN